MRSYNFSELFDAEKGFSNELDNIIPDAAHRMGDNENAYPARVTKNLVLPDIKKIDDDKEKFGESGKGSMRRAGQFMKEVFELNKENNNFRVFSPDETYSNKIDEVFKATERASMLPIKPWDKDISRSGKVVEMLSEHTLQGLMQGYVLTGRHGFFVSYEAFIQVAGSMADQYAKFLKVARSVPWRGDMPSFNYILTSTGWRQDHNGFSHQNPGFISEILQKHGSFVRAYFPADESSMLAVMKECAASKNQINIIVSGKTPEPQYVTAHEAEKQVKSGISIWDFVSEENPDIVFAGIGDYLTKETIAAIKLLKNVAPEIKSRFVNILELSTFGFGNAERKMSADDFEKYFTDSKPVIFNFHGYPEVVQAMLFHHGDSSRFSVHGYIENGSTTTPFDMHIRNKTSRYHLAIEAITRIVKAGVIEDKKAQSIILDINKNIEEHRQYILEHGVDPSHLD